MYRAALSLFLWSCAKPAVVEAAVPQATAQTVAPVPLHKSAPPEKRVGTSSVLPDCVADLSLGMPMAAVERLHTMTAPDTLMDFRLQREESFATGPVSTVIYYFDGDVDGHPLYELIVEWRDAALRDAWIASALGPRNAGDQWSIAGLAWPVRAWVFDRRYVLAAAIPGTEWAE